MIQLVFPNFPAQRIAMNPQNFRGAALIPLCAVQHALDKAFLKLSNGFVKQDSPLHHLRDEPFQLISHDDTLRIGLHGQSKVF